MVSFIQEHWFSLLLYWGLGYAFVLDYYYKNLQKEKGRMTPWTAFWIAFLCWFWIVYLIVTSIIVIRKRMKK